MSYKDQVAALAHHLGEDLGSVASEARPLALTVEQMYDLLTTQDYQLEAALYDYANAVTELYFGDRVSFRGLVEFSNVCVKDCGYCGIRKHHQTERYTMEKQEVVDVALWAFDHGYGSLMLQSGELPTEKRLEWTVNVIKEIKEKTKAKEIEKGLSPEEARGMGIAIGLGELPKDWYQELYDAGAHRYLLRIESSNPNLYSRLHPADGNHSWHKRVQALHDLRDIGYQLGTGVMVGLPGQTFRDLAGDLQFFRDIEADMIGTGPYIFADGTPVGDVWRQMNPEGTFNQKQYYSELLEVTCRFLSLARITLADVNISATTALQVLDPIGREIALGRGANQMMPILTATTYRKNYQLYAGKPCVDEGHEDCRACLTNRVKFVGKSLHLNDWADPPSYFRRRGLPYNAPTNIPESPCIRECKSCTELEH
jgi:[FeFe] hydrogenase H-cluster radical SAM maturase HydE